jgi:hypothetical protein
MLNSHEIEFDDSPSSIRLGGIPIASIAISGLNSPRASSTAVSAFMAETHCAIVHR